MGRPIAEILDWPSELFTYVLAEYRRQPWGESLQDVHFAQLAATVCNASGNFRSPRRTAEFLLLKPAASSSGLSEEARKYLKRAERGKRR